MNSTLRDVANATGVSTKTVSRVLNADKHVRPETREKVLEAMRRLQYHPDPAARSLRKGATQTIGVVVGHGPDVVFSNPFFAEVLRGIGRTLAAGGYKMVLMTYSRDLAQGELINHRLVDGFILMSIAADDPLVGHLQRQGIPLVVTTKHEQAPYVDVDNVLGAYLAVSHLLQLGHRRIGLVNGPPELTNCEERLRGYRRALEEAGVAFEDDLVVWGPFGEDSGYQLVQHYWSLPEPPTALFVTSDLTSIGVMRGVQQRGLRIPQDLSVIGFDGVSLGQYLNPPLTSVDQHADRKGTVAAEMVLKLVAGEEPRPLQITLPPDLVVRQSAGLVRRSEEVAR